MVACNGVSPAPEKAVLTVTFQHRSSRVELQKGLVATIGRSEDCTIFIDDPLLSRRHAELHYSDAGLTVVDLGSRNGTLLVSEGGSEMVDSVTAPPCQTRLAANDHYPLAIEAIIQLGGVLISVELSRNQRAQSAAERNELVFDPTMSELYELAERIADSELPVLILGESGVGKGVLASFIHRRSSRRARSLVSINCGALAENLLEAELFGYEKGAFTGAEVQTKGLLETADGGTIFLDEVGELTPGFQVKLLNVLESQQFMRVGGHKTVTVDIRYLAATNRDLLARIAFGKFREDLYYRLNGISLTVPALRDRKSEIVPLAERFLRESAEGGLPYSLTAEAAAKLKDAPWPGNVRQLRNVVRRAAVLCIGNIVGAEQVRLEAGSEQPPIAADSAEELSATSEGPRTYPGPAPSSPEALRAQAEALEKKQIIEALETCAGNQTRAAKMLGMTRRTFVTRLKRYNIPRPQQRRHSNG